MHVSPITPDEKPDVDETPDVDEDLPPRPYVDAWTSPSPDEEPDVDEKPPAASPDVDEKPPAASIKDPVWEEDPWKNWKPVFPKGPAKEEDIKEEDIINFIPIRPA